MSEKESSIGEEEDQRVLKNLMSKIPFRLRRDIFSFLNVEDLVHLEFNIGSNGKIKVKGVDAVSLSTGIGISYISTKELDYKKIFSQMYGYFGRDKTRTLFLIFPMVKIYVDFSANESGFGFGYIRNTSVEQSKDLENCSLPKCSLSKFIPCNPFLSKLQISGDCTWIHKNVSFDDMPSTIDDLSLIGGKHMSDVTFLRLLKSLPNLSRIYISNRWFNPPKPDLEFTDEVFEYISNQCKNISFWSVNCSNAIKKFMRSEKHQLEVLSLYSCSYGSSEEEKNDDDSFQGVGNHKNLRTLEVPVSSFCDKNVSEIDFAASQLKIMTIPLCKDVTNASIPNFLNLSTLEIQGTGITYLGIIELLKSSSRIRVLKIDGPMTNTKKEKNNVVDVNIIDWEVVNHNTSLERFEVTVNYDYRDGLDPNILKIVSGCRNVVLMDLSYDRIRYPCNEILREFFKKVGERMKKLKKLLITCPPDISSREVEFLKNTNIEILEIRQDKGNKNMIDYVKKECINVKLFKYSKDSTFFLEKFQRGEKY